MPDLNTPPPVTQDQAVDILKIASAYDGRKPSELQATVWAADLTDGRVAVQDAAQAVRTWYRDNPDGYIKPGHVVAEARAVRREAVERQRTADHLALTAGRPAEGSPEAAGVLSRLTEVTRRTDAAGAAVLRRPESRPCRYSGGPGTPKCTGIVAFDAHAEMAACDTCGMNERRFASGYGLADRGFALDVVNARVVDRSSQAWHDQFDPDSRAAKIAHPSGDDGGDGMAWVPNEVSDPDGGSR